MMAEDSFQDQLVKLVRAFGWHRPTTTPCGHPVPIAEAHALLELSRCGSITQRELALRINLQKSTVSRIVSNLEGQGWIVRRRSDVDGRARDVILTTAGTLVAGELASARQAKMDGILTRIPEEQREAVRESLDTLIVAMQES